MTIFLTIVFIIFLATFGSLALTKFHNRSLIRGWTYEAEPSGKEYIVTITDPDGENWGYTGGGYRGYNSTSIPKVPEKVSRRSYDAKSVWRIGSLSEVKGITIKCAKKKREQDALDARETIAGTF